MRVAALRRVLDQLFPEECVACGEAPTDPSRPFCSSCWESCISIEQACPRCALPIEGPVDLRCSACLGRRPKLTRCRASFEYGGAVETSLKLLKFAKRPDIGRRLRPLLQEDFDRAAEGCHLALPMPLHRQRHRVRGYNQSMRLLMPLARHRRLTVKRGLLRRLSPTAPQAMLSSKARRRNVQGAFEVRGSVEGKRVLLLDDVATTLATLDEAARCLRRGGATEVSAFVVARARSDR